MSTQHRQMWDYPNQTTATLVVGSLIVLSAVTKAIIKSQAPKIGDIVLILVFLAALPYMVTCLVNGGCTWIAWSIVALLVLLWLSSLLPRKKSTSDKDKR